MIIPVHAEQYAQDEYIVCLRESLPVAELRDRMLKRAKVVEGSYAFRMIDDLHAAIFVRSVDLQADYGAYFAREYETFGEYLRRRARFPAAVVRKLTKVHQDSKGMYHFRPRFTFLTDTYGIEFLSRLLDAPKGES